MSLIHEALRKARQEAAEQDAKQRPEPADLATPRDAGSRLGLGLLMGLALGALAAVALVLLWRPQAELDHQPAAPHTSSSQPSAAAGVSAAESQSEILPTAPASPEVPTTTASAGTIDSMEISAAAAPAIEASQSLETHQAEAAPVSAPPAATTAPLTQVVQAPAPSETSSAVAATDSASQGLQPTRLDPTDPGLIDPGPAAANLPKMIKPPESVGRLGDSNVFVLEADLGDTKVVLDFIVWSPSTPFAQINGKQVEVGQLVSGLLVEKIERDRVTLQATDGRLVLRIR